MGSASSKATRGAARKFPTRSTPGSAVSQTTRPPRAQAAQANINKSASGSKDQSIIDDATDPDFTPSGFASRLQQMGIVDPNPTYSPSSRAGGGGSITPSGGPVFPPARANATLSALEARRRVQEQAEADAEHFQRVGIRAARRRHVDMRTLADALQMLDRGVPAAEVEASMGMRAGLLGKLGRKGVLTHLAN